MAIRACAVDRLGQHLSQDRAELIDRDVEPRGQLLDGVATQYLLQLLRGDRQILAVSDPGFDLITEPALL